MLIIDFSVCWISKSNQTFCSTRNANVFLNRKKISPPGTSILSLPPGIEWNGTIHNALYCNFCEVKIKFVSNSNNENYLIVESVHLKIYSYMYAYSFPGKFFYPCFCFPFFSFWEFFFFFFLLWTEMVTELHVICRQFCVILKS